MRIGVVSDTHLSRESHLLPKALIDGLRGVDIILHLGDWTSLHVYEMLRLMAPCDGVAGNNDGINIIERFGYKKIMEIAGHRFGLVHGHGYHSVTEIGAQRAFQHEKIDILLFGHTHVPYMSKVNGMLLFNPGSPTDKRRQTHYSYGIIDLNENILARHYFYDSKL